MNLKKELLDVIEERQSVLVLGLGKSGAAAAVFFAGKGCHVLVVEQKSEADFKNSAASKELLEQIRHNGVEVVFENNLPADLSSFFLCVISPGINPRSTIPAVVREKGIRIIGELELGITYSNLPSIVVTGSNGKSTTVSIINDILMRSHGHPLLCGNIGRPILSLLDSQHSTSQSLVVEASSYQLESVSTLRPKIGVLLNISENHLERHGTIEEYLKAKCNLFNHQQKEDVALINVDEPLLVAASNNFQGTTCFFGRFENNPKRMGNTFAKIKYSPELAEDELVVCVGGQETVYDLSSSRLVGEHNRYNWAAAILAARLMGGREEAVVKSIENFTGLSHRLEIVRNDDTGLFINDSKSTTIASTVAALTSVQKAYPQKHMQLLLGGKMKKGSWEPLCECINKVKDIVSVITFGGDGPLIARALRESGVSVTEMGGMKEAVSRCAAELKPEDILLFSPGCASFDEFTDFEDRGDMFRSLVCPK